MTRSRFVAVLMAVGILSTTLSGSSQPVRIIIVPPDASLQAAIEAAPEGAVIQLQASEYAENLTIEKSITLRGFADAPERVLLGPKSAGPAVTVRGNESARIVLEGLTVHGARGYLPDGVFCQASGAVVFRSLVVRDCRGSGISVYGNGQVQVERCRLYDNGAYGLTVVAANAVVTGSGNRFEGNGAALGRYAPADLRSPLAEQTELDTARVPEDYATVQTAIDAVLPGGTVEIGDGEFREGLVLWKDVTLRGRGEAETTLAPLPDRSIGLSFLHAARSVTLEDLSVASSGAAPIESDADLRLSNVAFVGTGGFSTSPLLWVLPGGRLMARSSRFARIGGTAIRSDEGTTIDLADCAFEENIVDLNVHGSAEVADCRFTGTRDIAVYAERGELRLDRSVFRETRHGVCVGYAQGVVRDCRFDRTTDTGLVAAATSDVLVQGCTFTGGEHAVLVRNESTASLESCVLTGATAAAVEVFETGALLIKECEIIENQGLGVYVLERGDCTIVDSSIRSNGFNAWDAMMNEPFEGPGVRVTRNASLRMENVTVRSNGGSGVECLTEVIDSPLDRVEPEDESARVELIGCRFEANDGPALSAFDPREIYVSECEFARHLFGILLMDLASVLVEESVFTANTFGIYGQGDSELVLESSSVLVSSHAGLMLSQRATGVVDRTEFTDNGIGILLTEAVVLLLTDSTIVQSMTYGISLGCAECWPPGLEYDTAWDFTGTLAGEGNRIPDSDETGGNRGGAFCPEDVDRGEITQTEDST